MKKLSKWWDGFVYGATTAEVENINIDEKIYQDVYSAQQMLIDEANRILSKPFQYNEERYNTLSKLNDLGFGNAEQVKEFMKLKSEKETNELLIAKIAYYNQQYPFHRFIDDATVRKICAKYGLYLTLAQNYKSDIPEKNQKEIVSFKIKEKDYRKPREAQSSWFWPTEPFNFFTAAEIEEQENRMIDGKDMLIVAPEHKIDMRGKEKVGHIIKIKDPVVLQPVQLGYLIVSSWGLEASDELVVNPKSN